MGGVPRRQKIHDALNPGVTGNHKTECSGIPEKCYDSVQVWTRCVAVADVTGGTLPGERGQSVKKTFVLSLGLGIALGVAGTLLVQHGFRPRTPGLIRMTTISSERAHVDGVVQEQQLQRKVYSVYPAAAEAGNSSGTVLFRVLIAQDGSVDSVEYLSGPAVFVEGAKSAVQQYRYKPTVVGNMPVEVETIVAVPFVLPQ
jgi:hypothetical protein